MKLALAFVIALSACAPIQRVARPHERPSTATLLPDFALICAAGAYTANAYTKREQPELDIGLAIYIGLIALDTWATR